MSKYNFKFYTLRLINSQTLKHTYIYWNIYKFSRFIKFCLSLNDKFKYKDGLISYKYKY